MKLHIKFIVIILGCLMATGGYAQVVVREGSKVVIDASALPNSTRVKKATGTDGTDKTLGTNDASNLGSKVSNKEVYYRFEVSPFDNNGPAPWHQMLLHCKNLVLNGTGWRLPTVRELILIYLLKRELAAVPGFTALHERNRYWSATEESAENAHAVSLMERRLSVHQKVTAPGHTRCIRDL